MKKWVHYTFLLTVVLGITSCTEEISEEVQNQASSTSNSNTVDFTTKSIRLVHKMDEDASFLMHKSGDYSADCEFAAPANGFSSDDYNYTDSNYAIDCVLDVEELDLHQKGMEIELQVDDNLCEYIEYVPYSVYRFMPGRTERVIYEVDCDSNCSDDASPAKGYCGKIYHSYDAATGVFSDLVSDDHNLCTYDYNTQYSDVSTDFVFPNCDIGSVTTTTIELTATDTACTFGGTRTVTTLDSSTEDCGGKIRNCVDGAEGVPTSDVESTIYHNENLESFKQSWSYAPLESDDQYNSTMKYANFSRICADDDNQKTNDNVFASTVSQLKGYHFEDLFVTNTDTANNRRTSKFCVDGYTGGAGGYSCADGEATDYAENLYRASTSSYSTLPYYGFFCLDKAYDIKAQVRLFVRDWDRNFTHTNLNLNLLSDVHDGDPLMDARDTQQPNSGSGSNSYWNDLDDLDDFFEDKSIWDQYECTDSADPDGDGDKGFGNDNGAGDGVYPLYSDFFPGINY